MNKQLITARRTRWFGGLAAVAAVIVVVAIATTSGSEATQPDNSSPTRGASEPPHRSAPSNDSATPTELLATSTSVVTSGATSTTDIPIPETHVSVPSSSVHVVPTDTIEVRAPIDIGDTGEFGSGLVVEVADITAIDGVAREPGEIAGPALWVEVRVTNDSNRPISLVAGLIDVTYGPARTPSSTLSQPEAIALPKSLAPGESAVAAGVFVVPLEARDLIQVAVTSNLDAPIIVFEGAAPRD